MEAMIFAAGLGTRLKPLTDTMPKALVPVGGKPLLEILIRKLAASGFTDIVINVHHFADQIIRFVEAHDSFGVRIRFSDESRGLLDTGGGIRKAVPLLREGNPSGRPFLVHNVDILSNVDLAEFYRHGAEASALLLVSERETQRYLLFDDENRLVGWTNVKTGEVKSPYAGLDVAGCRKYAFAGIHLFSPRLFPYFEGIADRFSIIDFYLSVCDREPIYAYPRPGLKLLDVGKQDTLRRAEEFFREECC
ncbi:MAG: nucleotidyltransferase family protein [Paraprevotella sp.]|nr:nucleotidyltransferase family protein [Paraprevotella sp.]